MILSSPANMNLTSHNFLTDLSTSISNFFKELSLTELLGKEFHSKSPAFLIQSRDHEGVVPMIAFNNGRLFQDKLLPRRLEVAKDEVGLSHLQVWTSAATRSRVLRDGNPSSCMYGREVISLLVEFINIDSEA